MAQYHDTFSHCINTVLIVSARGRTHTLTYPNFFTLQPAWPWPSASQWHVMKETMGVVIDESWRRLKFTENWKNRVKNMESWRRLKAESLSKGEVPTRNWREKENGKGKEIVESGRANISVRAVTIKNGRDVECATGTWKEKEKEKENLESGRQSAMENWKEREKGKGKERVESGRANISVRAVTIRNGREVEIVESATGNWKEKGKGKENLESGRQSAMENWKEKEKGKGKEKMEKGRANISVRVIIRNGREVENVESAMGN